MNNSMVAHLWANEKKESARGNKFFFEGKSIYSYGYYFEIGRIVRNKRGEKAYLVNEVKERGLSMWPDVRDGKTVRRKKRL